MNTRNNQNPKADAATPGNRNPRRAGKPVAANNGNQDRKGDAAALHARRGGGKSYRHNPDDVDNEDGGLAVVATAIAMPAKVAPDIEVTVTAGDGSAIAMVDVKAIAVAMAEKAIAAVTANGISIGDADKASLVNTFTNVLDSTDAELVTEEFGHRFVDAMLDFIPDPEQSLSELADIQLGCLTKSWTVAELRHRYSPADIVDDVNEKLADRKLSNEFLNDLEDDLIDNFPSGSHCELVKELIITTFSMTTPAPPAPDETPAAVVIEVKDNLVTPPVKSMKVEITAGDGHHRDDIKLEVTGDMTHGGVIEVRIPAEPLKVLALHAPIMDTADVKAKGFLDPEYTVEVTAVLNRSVVGNEVNQAVAERLILEALALRNDWNYRMLNLVDKINFPFSLDAVDSSWLDYTINGPKEWRGPVIAPVTKTHKSISIGIVEPQYA